MDWKMQEDGIGSAVKPPTIPSVLCYDARQPRAGIALVSVTRGYLDRRFQWARCRRANGRLLSAVVRYGKARNCFFLIQSIPKIAYCL